MVRAMWDCSMAPQEEDYGGCFRVGWVLFTGGGGGVMCQMYICIILTIGPVTG